MVEHLPVKQGGEGSSPSGRAGFNLGAGIQMVKEAACKVVTRETLGVRIPPCPWRVGFGLRFGELELAPRAGSSRSGTRRREASEEREGAEEREGVLARMDRSDGRGRGPAARRLLVCAPAPADRQSELPCRQSCPTARLPFAFPVGWVTAPGSLRKASISSSVLTGASTIGEWPAPSIIATQAPGTRSK